MKSAAVALICFPHLPSKDAGGGHDRYAFELAQGIRSGSDGLSLEVVQLELSKG
jgi:hypothetical protein